MASSSVIAMALSSEGRVEAFHSRKFVQLKPLHGAEGANKVNVVSVYHATHCANGQ